MGAVFPGSWLFVDEYPRDHVGPERDGGHLALVGHAVPLVTLEADAVAGLHNVGDVLDLDGELALEQIAALQAFVLVHALAGGASGRKLDDDDLHVLRPGRKQAVAHVALGDDLLVGALFNDRGCRVLRLVLEKQADGDFENIGDRLERGKRGIGLAPLYLAYQARRRVNQVRELFQGDLVLLAVVLYFLSDIEYEFVHRAS